MICCITNTGHSSVYIFYFNDGKNQNVALLLGKVSMHMFQWSLLHLVVLQVRHSSDFYNMFQLVMIFF